MTHKTEASRAGAISTRTSPRLPAYRLFLVLAGVVEGLGHEAVGHPDLLREVGELLQVLLAEADLLLPPVDVDGEQLVEVSGVDLKAVGVELVLSRQDADRRLDPFHLAVAQLHQPQQGAQVVTVAGPEEVAVFGVTLEPVDVRENRLVAARR